jgi:hypothetical protein
MMNEQLAANEGQRVLASSSPLEERRASDLSYERFVREYIAQSRPLIVRRATPEWPALRKWTPEFFKRQFPKKLVQVSYEEKMTFSDFIDGVLASSEDKPGPYMYRLFLHEALPEVLPDLSPPNPYAFPRWFASPLMMKYWRRPDGILKLLIGGVGGRFPVMHFDGEAAHATITEIYGDKEFIMYSPEDTAYIYPSPERANHSLVDDPRNQDRKRFPLLAKATQYRGVLGPGDMVFVPRGWWHTARALSPSISVGMNIMDRTNWKGFVAEVCGPLAKNRKPRLLLKRAYLESLGPVLTTLEDVQRKFPGTAALLKFPSVLAPDSSAVAPDPSLKPLRISVPFG